ncbi:hypothetical protein RJ640_021673 [Escallonia rubra]|uniref:RING-type E3 ubiquitin transferase n=1 Tax=Escallonia rubra TaxID=112253 RepID=A0AA88QIS1_9ASTE|nr:hypothetical protein RJ640_021673 [Escallonia rubra]
MDDSCAVCADVLEWVSYGSCGHKEVCSTCVARLRFICNDRRCCICKTESDAVFVTKALGDYTRMINDFSVLPNERKEGRVGSYWYHEDTQSYFDDLDQYKMIKAMCRLSCSVCDKVDELQPSNGSKRRRFRNIEQLKGHLFHQHTLLMCSLCLEGRKVFICEQKLYTRAQLNQHINTGDSEVDGTESERGGFTGHPICEFCRTPFYGDNELFLHMSTDHYTCHICQRMHPGQYEYYKNYDDLEAHFRGEHFLCEDETCLAKKFIVFQSEGEMKRHNTLEHGGRMSRSQRNAALQACLSFLLLACQRQISLHLWFFWLSIPTSFRYRRNNEQDSRRGRGRSFQRDRSDAELCIAIQASLETAGADARSHDPSSSRAEISGIDPIIQPFDSLATTDSETASRYRQAVSQRSSNGQLEESSFPPLPMVPGSSHQNPKHDPEGLPKNTMAAHIRRKKNENQSVLNSAQAWPAANRRPLSTPTSPVLARLQANSVSIPSITSGKKSGQKKTTPSSYSSLAQARPADMVPAPSTYPSLPQARPIDKVPAPSSFPSLPQSRPGSVLEPSSSGSSSKNWANGSRISHSTSAPILVDIGSDKSVSDFPPVSALQTRKLPASGQAKLNVNEIQSANRSLVERIRGALQFDQDKYSAFKDISGEYRQGLIDAETYLAYVEQFGLSHLVLELASLCPDARKQVELVETYNANVVSNAPRENGWSNGSIHLKDGEGSKKGKGKSTDAENSSSKAKLADDVISTVRKLQSSYKPSDEEVEMLPKDGYRAMKGKSTVTVESQTEWSSPGQPSLKLNSQNDSESAGGGEGDGRSRQRKKTSKFHRVRLGDGSVAAYLDLQSSSHDPDPDPTPNGNKNDGESLSVRGAWRNGGGQKLLSSTLREPKH